MSLCIISLASSPCSCVSQFCNSTSQRHVRIANWKISPLENKKTQIKGDEPWMFGDQRLGLDKKCCLELYCKGPSTVKRTEKPYSPSTSGSKSMSCSTLVVFEKKIGHFRKNEGVCKWMSFVCQRLIQAFMSSTSFKILFSLFSDSDLGNSLRTVNVLRFLVDYHHHVDYGCYSWSVVYRIVCPVIVEASGVYTMMIH